MGLYKNAVSLIDLPMWEILNTFLASGTAGCSWATDDRGSHRYIYVLVSATSFWRYDAYNNNIQQLTSPPGGTVGAGTTLIFDPSRGAGGYIWALISSGSGAPTFQYYNIATDVWTARSVVGLPGTFGTDASMTHTCSTINPAGNDDYIYLVGNAATPFYRYTIAGNTWTSAPPLACLSTSGAGCNLQWMPGWNTDYILRLRGTATATLDYYSIVGNTWNAIAYTPAVETFTTGTIAAPDSTMSYLYIQKDATGRFFRFNPVTSIMEPSIAQNIVIFGAATVGDRLVLLKDAVTGLEFLYFLPHTTSYMMRLPLLI